MCWQLRGRRQRCSSPCSSQQAWPAVVAKGLAAFIGSFSDLGAEANAVTVTCLKQISEYVVAIDHSGAPSLFSKPFKTREWLRVRVAGQGLLPSGQEPRFAVHSLSLLRLLRGRGGIASSWPPNQYHRLSCKSPTSHLLSSTKEQSHSAHFPPTELSHRSAPRQI